MISWVSRLLDTAKLRTAQRAQSEADPRALTKPAAKTPPLKIAWEDLVIQDFKADEVQQWLAPWAPLVDGRVAPLVLSAFGDWFLQREDGAIDELSVLEGKVTRVAPTADQFFAVAQQRAWQETHLLSWLVFRLHQRGLKPGPGQCYAFAPHPAFTGSLDPEQVLVMPIGAWQHLAAQTVIRSGA